MPEAAGHVDLRSRAALRRQRVHHPRHHARLAVQAHPHVARERGGDARTDPDPASLNHLRLWEIWTKRARILAYTLFGLRKPTPDRRAVPQPHTEPGPLCLPRLDTPEGRQRRQVELQGQQAVYQWDLSAPLPRHVKGLPKQEAFDWPEAAAYLAAPLPERLDQGLGFHQVLRPEPFGEPVVCAADEPAVRFPPATAAEQAPDGAGSGP
jgi:hypothetical protein